MATNDDLAFPVEGFSDGMKLRDYFAAKAMQGMLANHEFNMTHAEYATEAYRHADAMLSAREAKP